MKDYLLGLGAVLLLVGVWLPKVQANPLGSTFRTAEAERTVFTTSTNANFTGIKAMSVADFRNVDLTLATESASGTLKFACSVSDDAPDFGSAQSATNRWDYIQVVDKEDGSMIDGDTGVSLSSTTDVRVFEINDNYSKFCTGILSGNTSPAGLGTTTLYLSPASNQ